MLLRAVFEDPMAAWHVRSLEFWGERATWADWRPFRLKDDWDAPGPYRLKTPDRFEAAEPNGMIYNPQFFSEDELEAFWDITVTTLRVSDSEAKYWLEAVRFIRQYYRPDDMFGNFDRNRIHRGLDFLSTALRALSQSGADVQWPPGFQSLQRLAVGVPSRAQPLGLCKYRLPLETALSFFLLPAAQSLYLSGIKVPESWNPRYVDEDQMYTWVPKGSSSVQAVFIDNPKCEPLLAFKRIIEAPKELRHFTIQGGSVGRMYCDRISRWAQGAHGTVLRSLLFYGTIKNQDNRHDILKPEAVFTPICNLDIHHVLQASQDIHHGGAEADSKKLLIVCGERELYIPIETEAIVFVGNPLSLTEADLLDDGLAAFLEQHGHSSTQLKALYLSAIDNTSAANSQRCFQRKIRAGKTAGIEVDTRTTPPPWEHSVHFPWPATDRELETSPFYGHKVLERYRLDPAIGIVEDKCRRRGACEDCFAVMPKEFWNKMDGDEEEDGSS